MRVAALGLALRGHEVTWSGPEAGVPLGAPPVHRAPGGLGHARAHADVVLGGPDMPFRTAIAGWLSRAHCMVLDVSVGAIGRWSALDRLGWDTLYATGLVEAAAAGDARAQATEPMLDRLALWSDGPAGETPDPAHVDCEILERACERSIARHRMSTPRAAVFLDRDGTLVAEREYLSDPEELELLPGVPEALKSLRAAGYALVVVSNQSGVGRGYFELTRAYEVMARLRVVLRRHHVELDAVYFCPHRPDEGCRCRKPGTLLLERAEDDLQLTLSRSTMVGDKMLDVETGKRAGTHGVLVRTGYGAEEERTASAGGRRPDYVADDMVKAARWIVRAGERIPT